MRQPRGDQKQAQNQATARPPNQSVQERAGPQAISTWHLWPSLLNQPWWLLGGGVLCFPLGKAAPKGMGGREEQGQQKRELLNICPSAVVRMHGQVDPARLLEPPSTHPLGKSHSTSSFFILLLFQIFIYPKNRTIRAILRY